MDGFSCTIALQNASLPSSYIWKKPLPFQAQASKIKRQASSSNYLVEQYTSEKFLGEKLWIDTPDYLFITEGVILNIDNLVAREKVVSKEDLMAKLVEKSDTFFENFEGNFVGLYHSKKENKWIAFNNQTATKRLFYFKNNDYFVFSTDLFTLCETLKTLSISYSMDEFSAYLMLSSGQTFENHTLVTEVKQLRAGEYLQMDARLKTDFYFHLKNIAPTTDSKQDILENLETKFREAVRLEYELDAKYNLPHLCTLSGGLDSRMTSLVAHEMGFKDIVFFNFSEKGYADEVISKKIAEKYDVPIVQKPLLPESLLAIDEGINVNDGLTNYTSCSHVFSVLPALQNLNFGATHTGIMGDTVMGSAFSTNENAVFSRLYSTTQDYPEQRAYINKLIKSYPTKELCLTYNLIFMGESNGFLYFDTLGSCFSPFLNTDFLTYAHSIPENFKLNRAIYIDWIKKFHPNLAQFTWEAIGAKPTNNQLLRTYYRYKRAVVKRLPVQSIWKKSMNPEQLWYDKNPRVKQSLDTYFQKEVDLVRGSKLRDDLIRQYSAPVFNEKAKCLTLLGAIKHLSL